MDTAINPGGDFDTDIIGRPYTIDGTDVILQKIYICLSGHRGGFIYDRELGGELYKIVLSDDNAEELLEIRAREAVKDIREAEVCVEGDLRWHTAMMKYLREWRINILN